MVEIEMDSRCQYDDAMFSRDTADGPKRIEGKFVSLSSVDDIPSNAVQIGKDVYIGGMSPSPFKNVFIGALTPGHGLDYVDVSNFSSLAGVQNLCQIYCCDSEMKSEWLSCIGGSLPRSGNAVPIALGKCNGMALYLGQKSETGEIGTVLRHEGSFQCFLVGEAQPLKDFEVLCKSK